MPIFSDTRVRQSAQPYLHRLPIQRQIQDPEVSFSPTKSAHSPIPVFRLAHRPIVSWPSILQRQQEDDSDSDTSNETETPSYTLSSNEGNIDIEFTGESDTTYTDQVSISDAREYLLKKYNWNAIVAIMKHLSSEVAGFDYTVPTDLAGTAADDEVIIPDAAILALVTAQTQYVVDEVYSGNIDDNIDGIKEDISGLADDIFVTDIMDEENQNDLRDETREANSSELEVPDLNSSESSLYDAFRALVLERNGLWSDRENIMNLAGIRRVLEGETGTQYNDTIAVCWLEEHDGEQVKRTHIFVGTTEPGNRSTSNQLVPQTMTVVPGFHNSRQPAGRTKNVLKISASDNAANTSRAFKEDTDMNVHPGGNQNFIRSTGSWTGWLNIKTSVNKGVSNNDIDTEDIFELNLLLSEVFLLLSKYGGDRENAAYKNLEDWVDADKPTATLSGTEITVAKGTGEEQETKTVDTDDKDDWLADYWLSEDRENGDAKLTMILERIGVSVPDNLDEYDAGQVADLIDDEHIFNLVTIQTQHLTELEDIDGKAGKSFYEIVTGARPSHTEAETDKGRLDTIIQSLEEFGDDHESLFNNNNPPDFEKVLTEQIKVGTDVERSYYYDEHDNNVELDNSNAVEIEQNVNGWSEGCQVIFGGNAFYQFWFELMSSAADSGQRRWYYTLVDESTLTQPSETSEGDVQENTDE